MFRIILESKFKERVFHGGHDIGDELLLKVGHLSGKYTGQDSGAIFFTPDIEYAKQYMKNPDSLYYYDINKDLNIFDINSKSDINKFKIGFIKNYKDEYSSKEDALQDYFNVLKSLKETVNYGAIDWATGSQYVANFEKAGFDGVKFLERPGKISLTDNGFDVKGNPVYSYAIFKDKVKVNKVKL